MGTLMVPQNKLPVEPILTPQAQPVSNSSPPQARVDYRFDATSGRVLVKH